LDTFVKLKRLIAAQNELKTVLLPKQSHLVHLDLSQNQLGPNPPDLSACTSLEYLNLSYNSIRMHISDDEPNATKNTIFTRSIGKCTQLRELNLSYNQIEWSKDDLAEGMFS
jgi:Leucine-rich repeat (LRR) protein